MKVIYTSRRKAIRSLSVISLLLALSVYLVSSSKFVNPVSGQEPGFIDYVPLVVACAGILFFLRASYVLLPLIVRKKKPFIRIDETGITDLFTPVGRVVKWEEVVDVKITGKKGREIVLVFVRDPEQFIEAAVSPFRKKIGRMRLKKFGTPVVFENRILDTDAEPLVSLLQLYRNDLARHRDDS